MPGRPRKPTKLKQMQGTLEERRVNPAEPKYDLQMPEAPAWLGEDAKVEWNRICPSLVASGVATGVDFAVLANYCQVWAEFVAATKTINEEGRYQIALNGNKVPHPALVQQRNSSTLLRSLAQELGLSPASRSKVSGNVQQSDDDDILDNAPQLRIAE